MLDLGKADANGVVTPVAGRVVDLGKVAERLITLIETALTWDPRTTSGPKYDPDVVAFALGENGKVVNGDERYFVRAFGKNEAAKNPVSPDGAIRHGGDDTSGALGGEKLIVDATKLDPLVHKIRVSVPICKAKARGHNFGLIKKCRITVKDLQTGETLVTGELSLDNSTDTAINAMDIFLRNGSLVVQYIGEGYPNGLGGLCGDHGIAIGENDYDDGPDHD